MHVVEPLSFLRSISLASLFILVFLFLADQISFTDPVLKQAAFSFVVLCTIMFSDPICCSFLTWFGHVFPAGQLVSVRSFLIARDIGQLAKIWI